MTTFHLLRHAERSGDQQWMAGRTANVPLTDSGRAQAERLAERLAREPINHLSSSPVQRAQETAAPLARRLGLVVEICDGFHEVEAGEWTGHTFPELDVNDERWRRFNQVRSTAQIPGGETMVGVQARFVEEMLRLRARFPDHAVALVSHADPIKAALAYFLGMPLDFYYRLEIGLASWSTVLIDEGWIRVPRINDTFATSDHGANR